MQKEEVKNKWESPHVNKTARGINCKSAVILYVDEKFVSVNISNKFCVCIFNLRKKLHLKALRMDF